MAVGTVAEIKGRLPVADVVGETVQLRKAGTTLKGLCPFHGEKTPSFVVTPGRDTWHCFGCGKHGDIFTFVMERDCRRLPRGAQDPRRSRRRRDRRAHQARGRAQRAAARGHGERDRLLPRGPHALEAGRAGARLPARPRLHGRDDRGTAAGLGAGRLGPARPPARDQAPGHAGRAPRGRARQPAPAWRRRLRPVPRARDLPDPRRERPPGRPRRPRPGQGGRRRGRPRPRAEVPQLAGDAAVRQEPHAVPHRPRQVGHPQDRPGRDRRGLHRRADGAPGRVRQRRRVAGHRAHARARSR